MRSLLSLLLLAAPLPAFAAPPSYTLLDLSPLLSPLGSFSDQAVAINNLGQVAGNYTTRADPPSRGRSNGFRYTPGAGVVDIGNLGGSGVSVSAINNLGQVAGEATIPNYQGQHAAIFNPPVPTVDLGTLGGTVSFPGGINDAGQVTGSGYVSGNDGIHAFLYSPGNGLVDLGTLGGKYSGASGINGSGQFTGYSFLTGDATSHAILGTSKGLVDIGTLPGSGPQAGSGGVGINDAGEIVGYSDSAIYVGQYPTTHAFAYTAAGGMVDLGVFESSDYSAAQSVNNAGQIVGINYHHDGNGNSTNRAFLYDSGTLYRLSDLVSNLGGGVLIGAFGINDSGQIVGDAIINGQNHAVILTPSIAVVPEPGVWLLNIAGFSMIGLTARRRRAITCRRPRICP